MDNKQKKVLEQIFAKPVRHNIKWKQIEHMFEALGAELSEGSHGHLKVELNGHIKNFSRPKHKELQHTDEVLALRHFLEEAGVTPEGQL